MGMMGRLVHNRVANGGWRPITGVSGGPLKEEKNLRGKTGQGVEASFAYGLPMVLFIQT